MKIIEKLLIALIILVSFDVLINFVNTLGLGMIAYEVKPLINEVKTKLSVFEMPDLAVVNELVVKVKPLLELLDEFNDPITRYYIREFKGFLKRCDSIGCADIIINTLPAQGNYFVNETWRE